MLHTVAESIAVLLFDKDDEYPLDVYVYGGELLISSVVGTVIILLLGFVFGALLESFVFIFAFSTVRFFSGGYHANTYLKCNTVSAVAFLSVLIVYKTWLAVAGFRLWIVVAVFSVSILITALFAPVENVNKPLDENDKKRLRLTAILVELLEFLVVIFMSGYFGFNKVLVILPTLLVVDIAILVEIVKKSRRTGNEKGKADCS